MNLGGIFMQERRSHKRLDIHVMIDLTCLESIKEPQSKHTTSVEVTDISRNGMGFITPIQLEKHTYYDAKLQIWTKEIIPVVIEIVRFEKNVDGNYHYGASFVGMMESEALKIDIYDMVHELS